MEKIKHVYIYNTGSVTLYFSTAKKVHQFALDKKLPIAKYLTDFKRWLTQDGHYQIHNQGYITVEKLR